MADEAQTQGDGTQNGTTGTQAAATQQGADTGAAATNEWVPTPEQQARINELVGKARRDERQRHQAEAKQAAETAAAEAAEKARIEQLEGVEREKARAEAEAKARGEADARANALQAQLAERDRREAFREARPENVPAERVSAAYRLIDPPADGEEFDPKVAWEALIKREPWLAEVASNAATTSTRGAAGRTGAPPPHSGAREDLMQHMGYAPRQVG